MNQLKHQTAHCADNVFNGKSTPSANNIGLQADIAINHLLNDIIKSVLNPVSYYKAPILFIQD